MFKFLTRALMNGRNNKRKMNLLLGLEIGLGIMFILFIIFIVKIFL